MKIWTTVAKLAVFAGIVVLAFWYGNTKAIIDATTRAGLFAVVAGFALSNLVIALQAAKWRLSMPSAKFSVLFQISLISQFYTFFFLGQASGEAAKAYMLSRQSGQAGGAIVSIFADRLMSFIGMLGIAVLGFWFSPSTYPAALQSLSIAGLAVLIAALLALRHDLIFRLAEHGAARLERASPRWAAFAAFLRQAILQWHICVRNLYRVGAGALMGALIHLGNVGVVMFLAHSIGIDVAFADWCWVVGLMSIAGLIPLTVGNVTAQGAMAGLLQLLGVPLADAIALAVLMTAVHFMLAMVGAFFEWRRWRQPRNLPGATKAAKASTRLCD